MIKKFVQEFKEFVQETDFATVAIGFLVATAVKDLCNSFFTSIVTPILNRILTLINGNNDAKGIVDVLGIQLDVSSFISQLISFFVMLLVAFFFLKTYNFIVTGRNTIKEEENDEQEEALQILKDIRDELTKQS